MPIMEDEHGTYIMNSKDLRAVEHVARLTQIGVDSLKIEGRTKSLYYVARTAQVYRRAIDDAVAAAQPRAADRAGRPVQPRLHRRPAGAPPQQRLPELHQRPPSVTQRSQYVGEVLGTEGHCRSGPVGDWVMVETKNHFAVGDLIEVVHPSGNTTVRLQEMRNVEGQPVQVAQAARCAWIPLFALYSGALLLAQRRIAAPAAAAEPALAVCGWGPVLGFRETSQPNP